LNWDHFRYFSLVAEQGSVSRAAQVAGVSHATVLRAIARLEQSLQLRLFDHARTGYRLTPDGEDIFENVREIGDEVQAILQKAKRRDSQLHGQISTVLPDPGMIDVLPRIAEFLSGHGEVTVSMRGSTPRSPDDFVRDKVDVAFLVTNNPPELLVGRKLTNIKFVLAGKKGQAKEKETEENWVSWGAEPSSGSGSEEFSQMQEDMRRHYGAGKSAFHGRGHDSAVAALKQGLGMGVISRSSLTEDLQEMNSARKPPEFGLWMLTHPDYRSITRISAFMRFMTEVFPNDIALPALG
jgi:DNA-binding transcriptional LysR family regulator